MYFGAITIKPFVVVLLSVIILAALGVTVSPYFRRPDRALSHASACESNLRRILQAVEVYRENNAGKRPESLQALMAAEGGVTKVGLTQTHCVCPGLSEDRKKQPGKDARGMEYQYLASAEKTSLSSANTCLLYCPPENHGGRWAVAGFRDGHTRRIRIADYPAFLAEQGLAIGSQGP